MPQDGPKKLWVDIRHPEHKAFADHWQFTEDHYTGAALDISRAAARNLRSDIPRDKTGQLIDTKLGSTFYLWRRAQGESADAFVERTAISKYPTHMAAIVDSFSGSIFSVEQRAERNWGEFGDVKDTTSLAHGFFTNADGKGTNWTTHFKKTSSLFTRFNRVWYLVETDRIIFPDIMDVVNWREEDGRLVEVLVRENVDLRTSIIDEFRKDEERFVLYTIAGFDRFRVLVRDDGVRTIERIEEESGAWDFLHFDSPDRVQPVLPIGFVDMLPIGSELGYMLAQGNNYLFNLLSDVRNIIRVANHPKLRGVVSNEEFNNTEAALLRGANMLQGDWQYIGPPSENAGTGYTIYGDEVKEYYASSHQRFDNAARESTATEARQQDQRGRGSFLTLLSNQLDELENRALFLLNQKQFPERPEKWLDANVARSVDFKPFDSDQFAERLKTRYFGGGRAVPVGEEGQINAARQVAKLDGLDVDDEQLVAEVQDIRDERAVGVEMSRAETAGAQQAVRRDEESLNDEINERRRAISNNTP